MLRELEFLCACQEMLSCQQELVDMLADHIGVPPEEPFYQAIMRRVHPNDYRTYGFNSTASGFIGKTNWKYHFSDFNEITSSATGGCFRN